jgi:hypothetical protein
MPNRFSAKSMPTKMRGDIAAADSQPAKSGPVLWFHFFVLPGEFNLSNYKYLDSIIYVMSRPEAGSSILPVPSRG